MPERVIKALAEYGSDPWIVGLLSILGASFAGLSNQLRSGQGITGRMALSAVMNSAIAGTVVFLLGVNRYQDDLASLSAMSILAGIGGATLLDLFVQIFRRRAAAIAGTSERSP